jgi:RNA ligase (TIGR02306 family)
MENLNSVCYVAKIDEIKAIEGADNIEQAVIGGWNCIVKKGSHTINDHVIIATTDAVIPEDIAESVGITNYLRKGNRVRTVKLRGVYSECLVIPATHLPISLKHKLSDGKGYFGTVGSDCMELLGIFKYEPPAVQVQLASGKKIRYYQNPNFHVYYKFPNIKNVAGIFNEDDTVQITRKLHGTNARYGIVKKTKLGLWDKIKRFFFNDPWIEYEYVYGSHNVEKGSDSQGFYDTDVWRTVAEKYYIKEKLWDYVRRNTVDEIGNGIVLYGEVYGPGIQKNYDYKLKEIQFAGFDITIDTKYQTTIYTQFLYKDVLKLPHVEVLYFGPWRQETQDALVFNNFIEGTKVPHEGVVIKHVSGDRQKVAKVINPDYLIYSEKHDVGDSH